MSVNKIYLEKSFGTGNRIKTNLFYHLPYHELFSKFLSLSFKYVWSSFSSFSRFLVFKRCKMLKVDRVTILCYGPQKLKAFLVLFSSLYYCKSLKPYRSVS